MDLAAAEVQLTKGNEAVSIEVGVCLGHDSGEEDAPASSTVKKMRRIHTAQDFNSHKVKCMNFFVAGQQCWCKTWGDFFSNDKKHEPA